LQLADGLEYTGHPGFNRPLEHIDIPRDHVRTDSTLDRLLLMNRNADVGCERAYAAIVPRFDRQQRRKHQCCRARMKVADLSRQCQRAFSRPPRFIELAQKPERIGQPAEADDFWILTVLNKMLHTVRRRVMAHRLLEVLSSLGQLTPPEGRNAEHVFRFYPQNLVTVPVGAGQQL